MHNSRNFLTYFINLKAGNYFMEKYENDAVFIPENCQFSWEKSDNGS